MAITTNEIKRMQRDIETLKKKVARLEKRKNGKRQIPARKSEPIATRVDKLSERERVRAILRQAGMLAELTPEEKARAARWRALPEEEKRRVRDELWNLKLQKPLSQIIIENR